jgi:hypothetical protein
MTVGGAALVGDDIDIDRFTNQLITIAGSDGYGNKSLVLIHQTIDPMWIRSAANHPHLETLWHSLGDSHR